MNWNSKYVSLDQVIAKVYRDMRISENTVNVADMVEWAGEAIELIGASFHLTEKVAVLPIQNYRAQLPCDVHYIITTKGLETTVTEECDIDIKGFAPMVYSTNAFHHYCSGNKDVHCQGKYNYKVNDDFIFPSFEEGYVAIAYRGIPIDQRGYPLIPDDIKFKEAVAGHIKWRVASILADEGKIQQYRYQKYEQDRDWYIAAAQTRANTPSPDMAESLKNNWLRLIPKINQHSSGFASISVPEQRYTHNAGFIPGDAQDPNKQLDTYFNFLTSN